MRNRSVCFPLGLAWTLALLAATSLEAQGEPPESVFTVAPFAGLFCSDTSWDPTTGQLYAVDAITGVTHIYGPALNLIGNIPSAFPVGSLVTGIATDPGSGQLFWSVFNGTNADLWSAPDATTPATFAGFINSISGTPIGMDCDNILTNTIYVNEAGLPFMSVIDYAGGFTNVFCTYPGTTSTGIAHRVGNFVELTTDALGAGAATHFAALEFTSCAALENVGVPLNLPGFSVWGFDYGPLTETLGRTMFFYESATNSLAHVSMHRTNVRGDADNSGTVSITDAVFIIAFLFGGGPGPGCMDSADADDDGAVGMGDAAFIAAFVSGTGPAPPAPNTCGYDPTPDGLRCDLSPCP